jgi:hypothetical protein
LFCKPNQTVPFEFIVTDIEGNLIKNHGIDLEITRTYYEIELVNDFEKYKKTVTVTNHQLVTSNEIDKPAIFNFQSELNSGSYDFKFTVYDEKRRINCTKIENFVVSGGKSKSVISFKNNFIPIEKLQLITNKSIYEPGENCNNK